MQQNTTWIRRKYQDTRGHVNTLTEITVSSYSNRLVFTTSLKFYWASRLLKLYQRLISKQSDVQRKQVWASFVGFSEPTSGISSWVWELEHLACREWWRCLRSTAVTSALQPLACHASDRQATTHNKNINTKFGGKNTNNSLQSRSKNQYFWFFV